LKVDLHIELYANLTINTEKRTRGSVFLGSIL